MPLDPFRIESVRKALRDRGLWLSKNRGQNYLVNREIARRIVLEVPENAVVLEVGTGLGALTLLLAENHRTYSVEIDSGVFNLLKDESAFSNPNLTLLHADFLEFDAASLPHPSLYLVSNLPYSISGEAIRKFISAGNMTEGVVMLQDDFVRRMMSRPGEPEYGVLSILSHYYLETRRLFDVPRNYFFPSPTVDSTVVRLKKTGCGMDQTAFNSFLRKAFLSRRKTLANNLKSSGLTPDALKKMGVDPGTRPEDLPLDQWPALFAAASR